MGETGQQGDLAESEGRCFSPRGAGWASAAEAMRLGQEVEGVRFGPVQRGRLAGPLRRAQRASRFWRKHSSRNALAQYLHTIFQLHFPFRNLFLRSAGIRRSLKTKTNHSHIHKSPVISLSYFHTSFKVDRQ